MDTIRNMTKIRLRSVEQERVLEAVRDEPVVDVLLSQVVAQVDRSGIVAHRDHEMDPLIERQLGLEAQRSIAHTTRHLGSPPLSLHEMAFALDRLTQLHFHFRLKLVLPKQFATKDFPCLHK